MAKDGRARLIPVFLSIAAVTLASILLVWMLGERVTRYNSELLQKQQALADVRNVLATVADAETEARGYLLTVDGRYLAAYQQAVEAFRAAAARVHHSAQRGLLPAAEVTAITELCTQRLTRLESTLRAQQERGSEAAREIVRSDVGHQLMERTRFSVAQLLAREEQERIALSDARDRATTVRTASAIAVSGMTLLFLIWVYHRLARDIAQRQRSEEQLEQSRQRLQGIVASAMDAIISIDEDQKIILFNQAAEKVFECPASEAIGSPLDRFIPARFRQVHRQHVQHFGDTGQTTRAMGSATMSLSGLRAGGEEFPIDASISQVQIGGHKLFTVILRDITQRKKAEEELQRLHAELERRVEERTADLAAANRELEAFGYSVSHDLRAPLRHVTGFVELLEKHAGPSLDETGKRYVRTISEASRRMGNLIDDLLTLSRIGRAALVLTEVDLRQLVDEALVQLAPESAGRPIEWKIAPLPHVKADATLLRNVIMNLLGNALKYTRGRQPATIEVGSRRENSEVICFIRDNGVGFDMQFVDKLFGVFQRLHRPEDFEGTGIGLASVRRIIQRHGGRTWAEGEVDKGATIYFSLPAEGEERG